MRYIAALALAASLGLGIASSVAPAFAGPENGGEVCYTDGVPASCQGPAQVTLNTGSAEGTVAGPTTPTENPFFGGDKN
jgi:hypothetical protein